MRNVSLSVKVEKQRIGKYQPIPILLVYKGLYLKSWNSKLA